MQPSKSVSIGQLAKRTGTSVSAIRFYEEKGLLHPLRDNNDRRRFNRADIRRVSFILITQQLGFSIREIAFYLKDLPNNRTPTKADWTRLSKKFKHVIDKKISTMALLLLF